LYIRNFVEDVYGENNTFDSAADIRALQDDIPTIGASAGTLFQRGELCGVQRNDDYFLIEVPNDSVHLSVGILSEIVFGDYDVSYTVLSLDEVERSSASEFYGLIDPEALIYVIQVTGDDVGTPYRLYWEINNVDQYDGYLFYNGVDVVANQDGSNNVWTDAYDLTQMPRLEPSYDSKVPYVTAIRDLIYDEDVIAERYSNSGNNKSLAAGHGTQLDDDWYRLQIPSWEVVTAKQGTKSIKVLKRIYNTSLLLDLAYEHADGNIDVEVYAVDELGDEDPSNDVLSLLSRVSLADDNDDLESIRVALDPLAEDAVYAIRVYGDNAGNDYSLVWREETVDLFEANSFVDQSHDLTLSSDVGAAAVDASDFSSTEDEWLHEMWQHNDANGNDTIDSGEMVHRGYGNQGTDDWYAIAVSPGSNTLDVQVNFYADDNLDYEYAPDDLDFAVDLYRLVDDVDLGIRKPVLVGRINDKDIETEPFPVRPHPIDADIDYPLTEPGGAIDPDTGERFEGGAIALADTAGGIYFIRIFYDNRYHPYTFKWSDGVIDNAGDAVIIDDYRNGSWSYVPDLELPDDILNDATGDTNGNGYPDWMEYALTLDPAQDSPGMTTVLVQSTQDIEANGADDEYYVVTFLRSTEAVVLGYEFTVLESDSLTNPFTAVAADQLVSEELVAPGVERVVYRSAVPVSDAASYFFQLQVTAP
jgi:hypothetical protein